MASYEFKPRGLYAGRDIQSYQPLTRQFVVPQRTYYHGREIRGGYERAMTDYVKSSERRPTNIPYGSGGGDRGSVLGSGSMIRIAI